MLRVLIVSLERNVRELRRLVLVRAGFKVEAPEMSQAAAMIESCSYDALVVGGLEESAACALIEAFRQRNPNGCVVVVGAPMRVQALANVAVDPFDPNALIQALQASQAH